MTFALLPQAPSRTAEITEITFMFRIANLQDAP